MARRLKKSIDYFSLDVDIAEDDKIALIEAQHGIEGFGVIIRLFCKIYQGKGYYYKWDEKRKLLFSKKVGIERDYLENIVNNAVKWGLFNKEVFEKYNILTSERIQKNYLEATKRREEVEIFKEFLVLNGKDVNNLNDNVNILTLNVNNSKQRKGKERKEKGKRKKKERTIGPKTFIKKYNKLARDTNLPEVRKLTRERRDKLSARMGDSDFVVSWGKVLDIIKKNTFLNGKSPSKSHPNWKADFDWLIKNDGNYVKVLEGKYNDNTGVPESMKKWMED